MRSLSSRKGSLPNPDLAPVMVTCVAWVLLACLIDPRGDFPLNDDWAFGLPVKAFLEHGSIRFTEFTCPTLITQMFWGGLFCLPAGFSFTALRVSTLTLGLVALVSQYFLLRRVGASPAVALVGTWTLGANPIFFSISYSFMTDVPFLCLMNLAVLLLFRGLERGRDGDLWAGLFLALLAMFIRQLALGIFVGFLVTYPFWRGIGRRWALQAVLPTVLALMALKSYEEILKAMERLPLDYYKFNLALASSLNDLAHMRLGVPKFVFLRSCTIFLYLGLIAAPFSLLLWPSWLARLSPRGRAPPSDLGPWADRRGDSGPGVDGQPVPDA